MLNDFERKALLNLLKPLGAFNVVARMDDYFRAYYTFFFEKEGLVISKTILYSNDLTEELKPCFSEFSDNVFKSIEGMHEDFEVLFLKPGVICTEDIEEKCEDIYWYLKYNHYNFIYTNIFKINMNNSDFQELNDFTSSSLRDKTSVIDTLRESFNRFAMTRDIVEPKILKINNELGY